MLIQLVQYCLLLQVQYVKVYRLYEMVVDGLIDLDSSGAI